MANVTPDLRIAINAAAKANKAMMRWDVRRKMIGEAIAKLLEANSRLRHKQGRVDAIDAQIKKLKSQRDELADDLPYSQDRCYIHGIEAFEEAGGVPPPAELPVDADSIIHAVLQCETNAAAKEMLKTRYGIHWNFDEVARQSVKKAKRK